MSIREELVRQALTEWEWFGKDLGRDDKYIAPDGSTTSKKKSGSVLNPKKETVEPWSRKIADYWLAIPSKKYKELVRDYAPQKGRLDGTIDLAWSAAFISYCMQMAGAGSSFPYSSGHATWIIKAIDNRKRNRLNAPLVGYKVGELPMQVGDLIGRPRGKKYEGVNYDNAVATGWFESHSDIVVDIDLKKKKAYVVGGNVGQSVGKAEVVVTADGKLDDPGGWIVHIQNNIVPAQPLVAALTGDDLGVG